MNLKFCFYTPKEMPKTRAVSHADLAPSPQGADLGSKTGAFLTILTILCGLCCFILCIIAESTRSQMGWVNTGDGNTQECVYSGSGKTPLLCSASAFVGLAGAMVVEHVYMLIAVTKSPPPALVTWDPNPAPAAKSLTWQAAFFFVTTWICFAVGEILLLIGISVESGHLTNWSRPRLSCLIIREGLFSAAGVFTLLTVFLAAGLYLTALHAQKLSKEHEIGRREMIEASTLYASPPQSPARSLQTIARENPVTRETQNDQPQLDYPVFVKHSNLV
ncbi:hypothetical protein HS088_TW14G01190 [Tripterygium wilfordii]|uniref:Transmembrane protein n=1 Tax=Tripterygium wilfordii TaxID=458696 RepID=A0A7J7CSM3_TRIWF|nr:uncharacterized protein LOC120015039 isoform X2 [Tripterygium wilfordii]XP_038723161.1 uncharacterized protein LOC120015039 isoform X2 [Tripterygium wilfordii]XP_038723162.1 uncharacterized protein LOC120015039 isoform X2 [Tripterygium wilfordii]XP_038723163.1 uncharacterized protein LOC120015039 isoform X2 [Tripterygium wilfordii]KAF5737034.1 hypothetical protein HS088_TW14G01190 [Tripterygium wilfordii]